MPRIKQQKKWSSQKARRERKRAISDAWQEEFRLAEVKQQEATKKRVEAIAQSRARGEKERIASTNLWDWGFKSENHAMGILPYIIISVVSLPVLGILYKLSFTLFVPLALLIGVLFGIILKKIKS